MSDWSSGIDAAARAWNDEWGTEFKDEDRETVKAVIAAFLSVQPSIRWCEEHKDTPYDDPELCTHFYTSDEPCRIVERKLVDAPHIG